MLLLVSQHQEEVPTQGGSRSEKFTFWCFANSNVSPYLRLFIRREGSLPSLSLDYFNCWQKCLFQWANQKSNPVLCHRGCGQSQPRDTLPLTLPQLGSFALVHKTSKVFPLLLIMGVCGRSQTSSPRHSLLWTQLILSEIQMEEIQEKVWFRD